MGQQGIREGFMGSAGRSWSVHGGSKVGLGRVRKTRVMGNSGHSLARPFGSGQYGNILSGHFGSQKYHNGPKSGHFHNGKLCKMSTLICQTMDSKDFKPSKNAGRQHFCSAYVFLVSWECLPPNNSDKVCTKFL